MSKNKKNVNVDNDEVMVKIDSSDFAELIDGCIEYADNHPSFIDGKFSLDLMNEGLDSLIDIKSDLLEI